MAKKIYFIETPTDIFWSDRKLSVIYKHIEFSRKDKTRYLESNLPTLESMVQKSNKPLHRVP